jgi:Asp/Glu/hydantoin racemase
MADDQGPAGLLLLVNPNTSAPTTARMVEIAAACAPAGFRVAGLTARFGAPLITDAAALATARQAVAALAPAVDAAAVGVIVSAFGDPGREELARALTIPVVGIGEAGIAEAAAGDRPFAIVTTTPRLVPSIDRRVAELGHAGAYRGVFLTGGDPEALTADPQKLTEALAEATRLAIAHGAAAVVIGGGPLAVAARALAAHFPVPIIEPIPAAVRAVVRRIEERGGR